jgi:hypothetical protein
VGRHKYPVPLQCYGINAFESNLIGI